MYSAQCLPNICPSTSVLNVISDTKAMLHSHEKKIPSIAMNLLLSDSSRTPCYLHEEVSFGGLWHVLALLLTFHIKEAVERGGSLQLLLQQSGWL